MTIRELAARGMPRRQIARVLSVDEKSVRYHLARAAAGATDGRRRQPFKAAAFAEAIGHWLASQGEAPLNMAALHEWLLAEHAYTGSLRGLERYFRRHHPAPAVRARRRVETPPGSQAQADWAEYRQVDLGSEPGVTLYAFHLQLSHSRYEAIVWSARKDLLAWLAVHNEAWRRLGGIAATVRVDNEKTAVVHGAGAWGGPTSASPPAQLGAPVRPPAPT